MPRSTRWLVLLSLLAAAVVAGPVAAAGQTDDPGVPVERFVEGFNTFFGPADGVEVLDAASVCGTDAPVGAGESLLIECVGSRVVRLELTTSTPATSTAVEAIVGSLGLESSGERLLAGMRAVVEERESEPVDGLVVSYQPGAPGYLTLAIEVPLDGYVAAVDTTTTAPTTTATATTAPVTTAPVTNEETSDGNGGVAAAGESDQGSVAPWVVLAVVFVAAGAFALWWSLRRQTRERALIGVFIAVQVIVIGLLAFAVAERHEAAMIGAATLEITGITTVVVKLREERVDDGVRVATGSDSLGPDGMERIRA